MLRIESGGMEDFDSSVNGTRALSYPEARRLQRYLQESIA